MNDIKPVLHVILAWCDRQGEEPEGQCLFEIENACRDALGLDLLKPNSYMPESLQGHINSWLLSNEKASFDVKHGRFPLGMVQRWIERAESAEAERDRLREAILPFAAAAGRPGRLLNGMNDEPLPDDAVLGLGVKVSAWKRANELTQA